MWWRSPQNVVKNSPSTRSNSGDPISVRACFLYLGFKEARKGNYANGEKITSGRQQNIMLDKATMKIKKVNRNKYFYIALVLDLSFKYQIQTNIKTKYR